MTEFWCVFACAFHLYKSENILKWISCAGTSLSSDILKWISVCAGSNSNPGMEFVAMGCVIMLIANRDSCVGYRPLPAAAGRATNSM